METEKRTGLLNGSGTPFRLWESAVKTQPSSGGNHKEHALFLLSFSLHLSLPLDEGTTGKCYNCLFCVTPQGLYTLSVATCNSTAFI